MRSPVRAWAEQPVYPAPPTRDARATPSVHPHPRRACGCILGAQVAVPRKIEYQFRTQRKAPKLGLMLVGWGGNNGRCAHARRRLVRPCHGGGLPAG